MAGFKDSFAAARKAGKKTFSWNGKSYNTKLAPSTPKKGPVPAQKPVKQGPQREAVSGASRSTSGKVTPKTNGTSGGARERADYPKPNQAVGIARKGSVISNEKARQDNKPKKKQTGGGGGF